MKPAVKLRKQLCILQVFGGDILQLQDDLLKSFADAVNSETSDQPSDRTVYAEVTRLDGDIVYVKFDGSDIETPATSMVQVGVTDRVFASIKDHSVVITGNISFPSLTRVGDVYITLRDDGLVVGKLDKTNRPTDMYILITDTDFRVINKKGDILARFGTTAQIGLANGRHLNLTNDGVEILNNATSLAKFSDSLVSLANGLAQFSSKLIKLGDTSDSQIQFCNGNGVVSYASNKFKMEGNSSTQVVGVSNSYGNYKSELLAEAKSGSQRAGIQVLDGDNTVASVIASSNGVNCTTQSGKHLTENGVEVVKVDGVVAIGTVSYNLSNDTTQTDTLNITITASDVPSGYKLIGLSVLSTTLKYSNHRWLVSGWSVTTDNRIRVELEFMPNGIWENTMTLKTSGYKPNFISFQWFAIRTSGAKVAPDQTIVG